MKKPTKATPSDHSPLHDNLPPSSPQSFFTSHGLLLAVIALIIARIIAVPTLQGFYFDETVRKTVVDNYLEDGSIEQTNFTAASIPFYILADADWSPWPTFYAPAITWAKIFGSSKLSLRFFAEFTMIAAILLFAWGFSLWFPKKRHRSLLLFAIIGLSVPWLLIQGMVFWNPTLIPFYFAISFLTFSLLVNRPKKHFAIRCLWAALTVFGLICVAYTYKPPIVPAAILCVTMLIYWWIKKTLPKPAIIAIILAAAVLIIPFILFYFTFDGANNRTTTISIFSLGLPEMIGTFFYNFFQLISPIFLFIFGDTNLRHNMIAFGTLGPALIIPIIHIVSTAIKKRLFTHEKTLLRIASLTIFLTYLGVASTNEGMPHALRAVSAALPFCIIASLGLIRIIDGKNHKLKIATYLTLTASIITYFLYYFIIYAPNSGGAFDA